MVSAEWNKIKIGRKEWPMTNKELSKKNKKDLKENTMPKTNGTEMTDDEKPLETDWAESAYQELADYIEEQGIYIRY